MKERDEYIDCMAATDMYDPSWITCQGYGGEGVSFGPGSRWISDVLTTSGATKSFLLLSMHLLGTCPKYFDLYIKIHTYGMSEYQSLPKI